MTLINRHKKIIEKLKSQGEVDVQELSQEFNVSLVTIRKDLKAMEDKGLLFKAHGKAYSKNPYVNERSINIKAKINITQKEHIAAKASKLVNPGEHIVLASGTSINGLATYLKQISPLTVVSASLTASSILSVNPSIDVVQLGGHIRSTSCSVVGSLTEKMLEDFNFTKLFIGVDGIDTEIGLTTTSVEEASLNQLMIKYSLQVIVLADSSKFGLCGFGKICDIDDIDIIVTDKEIKDDIVQEFKRKGVQIIIA